MTWEGRPVDATKSEPFVNGVVVTPGYFSTMKLRVVAGRTFADADAPDAPRVMMVSETVVRRCFGGTNPVGRRARYLGGTDTSWMTIALVLTAAGVYGVISYAVAQRTHEIGVRIALGAGRGDVVGMVVRQVPILASMGLVIGGAGAIAAGRVVGTMLYDVTPTDPPMFVGVAALVLAVSIAAALLPAVRAARTDPIAVLRGG